MKKIRALALCAILLIAWCVPVSAAGASNYNDEVLKAVGAPFTVGNHRYSLPDTFTSQVASFLSSHPVKDQSQADAIVAAANSAQSEIENKVVKGGSADLRQLSSGVRTQINSSMQNAFGISLHFDQVSDSIQVKGIGSTTVSFPIPILDKVDISSPSPSPTGGGSSGSVSNVPSGPVAPIEVVTTGGGIQVNVSGVPDSAPTVTGDRASLSMTVSTDAVAAVSSATAQAPAAINISTPSDTIISQLNDPAVQSVSVSLNVPASIAYGTLSNTSVGIALDPSVLSAAAANKKAVAVNVTDSLTGRVAYSWTFNGADAAAVSSTAPINLALNVQTTALNPTVSGAVPSANKGVLLTFANNGALPVSATVRVYVGDQGFLPGQMAYLYYYNPVTNQIEALENSASVVDADGYATFSFGHSSQYVVLPQKVAAVPHLTIDTGKYLSVKAGHSYQFKITAASKPTFECGSVNVFRIIFAGSNGNNYFFKVIAVGKPGQGTGFYVNGQQSPCTIGTITQ
jgi:hypothetical protein